MIAHRPTGRTASAIVASTAASRIYTASLALFAAPVIPRFALMDDFFMTSLMETVVGAK